LLVGCTFVVASIYIPYNTFGEDIKMYKDSGLTLVRVLGIFLAVWAASKSLAEEIEGRTALTVLSKPVSRRQFIIGKYVGIGMSIALLFIAIGVLFYVCTAYKPVYDSGESTIRDFEWTTCHLEAVSTLPGMILAFLEAMIFAAISVVISTRLGILANFMICFSIYILGHLTPLIVQSAEVAQSFEGVVVFGQLISIIFPVLDHFDINAAITGGVTVPTIYLGWSAIYCALYGVIALLLALVLFEDRDLA
jgi:ABC-type transport system involved in multi-copper enzyme maturation permease subunit